MNSPLPATVYCRNLPYLSARRLQKRRSLISAWCRDSSVGYQLEDGEIGFRFPDGWDTVILSIPQIPYRLFGPPCSQSYGYQRKNGRGMKLTGLIHLGPTLGIRGAIPPLHCLLSLCVVNIGTTLPLNVLSSGRLCHVVWYKFTNVW